MSRATDLARANRQRDRAELRAATRVVAGVATVEDGWWTLVDLSCGHRWEEFAPPWALLTRTRMVRTGDLVTCDACLRAVRETRRLHQRRWYPRHRSG